MLQYQVSQVLLNLLKKKKNLRGFKVINLYVFLLLYIYIRASECVDLELREKQKLHSDLEKAEKLKSQLASEVDEHHSTIERINDLNLR